MAGYADTPLTGAHFAAFCEKMVGQPYWYGACCYKATQSLLSSKSKQYPGYYTAGRMDQCQRDIAARAVHRRREGLCLDERRREHFGGDRHGCAHPEQVRR